MAKIDFTALDDVTVYPTDYRAGDFQTYDDWQRMGRHVTVGQRSYKRNPDGVALFHWFQTSESCRSFGRRLTVSGLFDLDEELDLLDDECTP
jgi:hypothetical protein